MNPINPAVLPSQYQQFIHLSRYARWDYDKKRRETWGETVDRYFTFFQEHLKETCDYDLGNGLIEELREDERLRALCLTGSLPLNEYIKMITDAGFGTIEIRAKRPYRILDTKHYATDENLFIESIEVCAIKDPMPADGPCIFTGKTAIYFGEDEYLDDKKGHVMLQNQPLAICDKTAGDLAALNRDDIFISESTYFYDGGGCC